MHKKLKSLLLVFGLMLVLPLSIAAVGTINLDIDSERMSCEMPLMDSPSGVEGDMIAISTLDGESCGISNGSKNTYDVAIQYRSGPAYRHIVVERYRDFGLSIMTRYSYIEINQNDLLRRLVTSKTIELRPNDLLIISNKGEGTVNIEGLVVRKR